MGIFKHKEQPVYIALAFLFGFVKLAKANIDHAYKIIANLRVKLVGKGNVLHNLIAVLSKIRVKVEETEHIDLRNIIVNAD
jgi:hypothetical protein